MNRTINSALKTAVVLGVTLGIAGGLTTVTAPLIATPAAAFGLGDITGAAKKVGGAVKKGAKFAGKAGASMGVHAGKTAVRAAQGVRDGALTAAGRVTYAPTGVLAPLYFRATGQWNDKNKQILKDMERQWNDMFDGAGDKMDKGIRRVGGAAGEFVRTGGVTSGESLPRAEPSPEAKRRMQNGLRDIANSGGLNRSAKTGLAKGGAFYNRRQGKTIRNTVVRDHSLTGRPIGLSLDGKDLPRHGSRPIQRPRPITADDIKPSKPFCNSKFQDCSGRPRPITKDDIKPSRPFCNSKFENCSGKNGKKDRHGRKGKKWNKHGARDKSVWSHRVGSKKKAHTSKRNQRKFRIKGRHNKRAKIRFNNKKRSFRNHRRNNRRG